MAEQMQLLPLPVPAAYPVEEKMDEALSPSLLIDFDAPYQDLLKKISKLIECPVCLEIMRPGTKTVGMCQFGHVVCCNCYEQVITDEAQTCPLCRSDTLNFHTCHYLATNLIEIVTSVTVFVCQHPDCTVELLGKGMLSHEKECAYKLLDCPKLYCKKKAPYFQYLAGQHRCLNQVFPNTANSKKWQTTIDFRHIYSVDTINPRVSPAFKPLLLLPPAEDSTTPHRKIYVGACQSNLGMWLYVSSFENEKDISQELKHKKFDMLAEVYTYAGRISLIAKVPFLLPSDVKPNQASMDGLHLGLNNIINFVEMTTVKACTKCDQQVIHMHLTIEEI
jgi:hypothetical protein